MTFVQRQVTLTFTLQKGTFAESGTNQVTIAGLRVSARVMNGGGTPGLPSAQIIAFGVTLSIMNRLSTMGNKIQEGNWNTVTITAGDIISGFTKVFTGNIINAYADFSQSPQVAMRIEAQSAGNDNIQTAKPASYQGNQDVGSIISTIAGQMNNGAGYPLNLSGVNVQLSNPYLWGPLRQQLIQVIQAGNLAWNGIEDGTLGVWPRYGNNGKQTAIISPATGMVGYPSFIQTGLMVRTVFNPLIKNGSPVQVISTVLPVPTGTWTVYANLTSLDAQVPGGEWYQTLWLLNPTLSGSLATPVGTPTP